MHKWKTDLDKGCREQLVTVVRDWERVSKVGMERNTIQKLQLLTIFHFLSYLALLGSVIHTKEETEQTEGLNGKCKIRLWPQVAHRGIILQTHKRILLDLTLLFSITNNQP